MGALYSGLANFDIADFLCWRLSGVVGEGGCSFCSDEVVPDLVGVLGIIIVVELVQIRCAFAYVVVKK
ncbi:hypothetical protein PCC6912_20630 [Chlorogloeopsis fritschii PCC 6912]|uniref:Uncharacterized protein n=1 Tax=Chlorogloeopsis fritschii PCC 6912 TaxID=211165 RepID=A0A433NLL9_CHLFR|nr:hypothetical protein PCC6912_20630 [Chlorogloeopsis fritschii PCC 6912]